MAGRNNPALTGEDDSILGTGITVFSQQMSNDLEYRILIFGKTRHVEAFGRKVTTTASHLIGPLSDSVSPSHYSQAMTGISRELRRPGIQQRVFSYAQSSPSELVRSKLSITEIQHRALTFIPDDILRSIPKDENSYSLFQGFQATIPEEEEEPQRKKGNRRHGSRGQKLLEDSHEDPNVPPSLAKMKKERDKLQRRLKMMGVRKNMCSSEIREVDNKISNLNTMRKIVLDRLSGLEDDELKLEHELMEMDVRLEDLQEELEDAAQLANTATPPTELDPDQGIEPPDAPTDTFMSASIYEKLPSPKSKRHKMTRRKSAPIRHEHFEPGTSIKAVPAHNDMITALDFDAPFGTMVTSALDDTVRVWDLNQGRCIGLLEGHRASVRCLQVEDALVATGSIDASVRIWDLSRAEYIPYDNHISKSILEEDEEAANGDEDPDKAKAAKSSRSEPPSRSSFADCEIFCLEAHVDEVTALHFRGNTLVSGSSDKTLRQWDLEKGRCVQTLDVLWAAAQASATQPSAMSTADGTWRNPGRVHHAAADFVGALQSFDAALACGTADGMVRLWDLRSGQVGRSLVGHTGPITSLQFDDTRLVTGSLDRSIRIWDLRTGGIFDAYAYDHPVTSMMFDTRRIVAAAGENVVKVYDTTDGRYWDCGAGTQELLEDEKPAPAIVEQVRIKDGYLIEGRKDGTVGVWTC
ncbi:Mitochondrial fission protein [Agyrium rufum]|nr:Mitochondrial fission protein [Agyrium rufum]